MKKIIGFMLFFAGVICLSACNLYTSKIEGNPDPAPMSSGSQESQPQVFWDFGVEEDSSYDNITAKTEKDSYPSDTEQIYCTVQNNNVGKAFFLYEIPFIEKKIDGNWIRLYYDPDRLDIAQWVLCAIEGNTTEPHSMRYIVKLDDISPKVTPGEYRLVVFTAKKTIYAPFILTK